MNAAGLLVLRLVVAVVLLAHGSHQVFGLFAGPAMGPGGLATTAARFNTLGLEPGYPLAVMAGTIQITAGALIAIGVLVRWASVASVLYLGIIMWKDQWRWGLFANWMMDPERGHGVEISAVLAGALVCLILAGGGEWSIDGRRAQAAAARASGRARLRRN
jgi:putative oxidoreductase